MAYLHVVVIVRRNLKNCESKNSRVMATFAESLPLDLSEYPI